MTVRVKVVGADKVAAELHKFAELIPEETLNAMLKEGELLLAESKPECPIDHSPLRNSGYTTKTEDGKGVEIGYSQEYALIQHERLDYHHTPPTKAKYLEDPFDRRAPTMHANIANALRRKYR